MKKIIALSHLLLLFVIQGNSQLVIDGTITPTSLVQNYLVGSGVTISNVTFNGMPGNAVDDQIGFFNGLNTNLGIDSGLVLSTGLITGAIGPNNNGGFTENFFVNSADPDLAAISSVSINDAAILEFDFVPTGDTVEFRYSFASEEYMEYVGGGINDAFGIFLSGGAIAGPYLNGAVNIALIPGTTTPVTIDNVNAFTNSAFYIDNGDGVTAPFNTGSTYIQYDGRTVTLTAKYPVDCGGSYHLKFAIADGSDGALDSGVFIEAGSLTSSGVQVSLQTPSGFFSNAPGVVYEDCALGSSVDFIFVRPDSISGDTVNFIIGGNAINGVDYSSILNSYVVFNGSDTTTLTISALSDNLTEGIDTVWLAVPISNSGPCALLYDTVFLYISDPYILDPVAGPDSIYYCTNQVYDYIGSVNNGIAPYDYTWSNGTVNDSVSYTFTQNVQDTLILNATDACGFAGADTVLFTQGVPPPLNIDAGPDSIYYCIGESFDYVGNVTGGVAPYVYTWSNGTVNDSTTFVTTQNVQDTLILNIVDACGFVGVDTVLFTQSTAPSIIIDAGLDQIVTCVGQTINLVGTASGGVPNLSSFWSNNMPTMTIQPTVTTMYYFTAVDNCNNQEIDSVLVTVPPYTPFDIVRSDSLNILPCLGNDASLFGYISNGGTAPYSYMWSNGTNDSVIDVTLLTNQMNLTLTMTDACGLDTVLSYVVISGQTPVTFNLSAQRQCRNSDSTALLTYTINGGSAPFVLSDVSMPFGVQSATQDASTNTLLINDAKEGIYTFSLVDVCGQTAVDSVDLNLRSCEITIPNVMTPNGDGVNDLLVFDGLGYHPNTELYIYNRWGTLVYSDANYQNNWNGGGLNAGLYYFVLRLSDGSLPGEYNGHINLFY